MLIWLQTTMAMQRFELDVDTDFNIHTSYYNDFFLLRSRVLVNGKNTETRSINKEGRYKQPTLNFCQSGSTIGTLSLITNIISSFLPEYGVYHVDTFYYEQSPLFHVVFSSESCLRKFLQEIGNFKYTMELELLSTLSECLKSCRFCETESLQHFTVEVQPDLFLVSPNRQETKGAKLHLVTAENCSSLITCWKDSKLFDFRVLYQEEGIVASFFMVAMNLERKYRVFHHVITILYTRNKPLSWCTNCTACEYMHH